MRVVFHHPKRETDLKGPITVDRLLKQLAIIPETVLVIRGDDLVTEDEVLNDKDTVEIRPVISGG